MAPRHHSAPSTELEEGTNAAPAAGGAPLPQQGALSKELAAGAEAAAAGTVAAPEPGPPRMELDPQTEAALAGHILAHGEADFLDPAVCLICNNHTFGEAAAVTSSCGHPFHPKCIEDAMRLNKTKCPCGAAIPSGERPVVANHVHKRMMDRHKVQCPQGCGEVIPFGNLHEHVHNAGGCSNTPYRCGNAGCGVLFLRKDKDKHLGSCPHRLVPCELCEQPIKDGELLQHKAEQCARRKVRCPHCEGEHIFCDQEKHMRSCTGGVSMKNITELKEMMAQIQQTVAQQQQTIERQGQTIEQLQHTNAQQQQTSECQQREIAELREFAHPNERRALPAAFDAIALLIMEQGSEFNDTPQVLYALKGAGVFTVELFTGYGRIEIDNEVRLAELQRLEQQQMRLVPGLAEERHRYITVYGPGGDWHGRYSLRPERVNSAAVWGKGAHRIYRSREGHWVITSVEEHMQLNQGCFRLVSQPGSVIPLSGGGWEYCDGHHWDLGRADGWTKDQYSVIVQ